MKSEDSETGDPSGKVVIPHLPARRPRLKTLPMHLPLQCDSMHAVICMKRLATSKDMLYEQKLAQDFEALDDAERRNANPFGRPELTPEEEMEAQMEPSVDQLDDSDWDEVQENLRNDVYGAWHNIRSYIAEKWSEENPGEGIGSSDFNHIAYDMVKSGELVPVDDPRTPRVANNRDRVAEVWKQVEQSIYQGPDSALPEVIEILEGIPEVIALAATREREPSLEEQNAAEMDAELAAEQRYLDQGL